jgi:hypothetical protein
MKKDTEKEIKQNLKFISILILFASSVVLGLTFENIILNSFFVIIVPFIISLFSQKLIKWIIK